MNIGRGTKTLVEIFSEYTKISLKTLITDNRQAVRNDNNLDAENIENQITMTQI